MSGCDRVLARLERGPATAAELYASTYCVVHSRVASLREKGYVISCERVPGDGAAAFLYTLLSSPIPDKVAHEAGLPLMDSDGGPVEQLAFDGWAA